MIRYDVEIQIEWIGDRDDDVSTLIIHLGTYLGTGAAPTSGWETVPTYSSARP